MIKSSRDSDESEGFIKPQVEPSSEETVPGWNPSRSDVLPVTDEFRSGISSIPRQSLSPIWRQVSRPTVLAGSLLILKWVDRRLLYVIIFSYILQEKPIMKGTVYLNEKFKKMSKMQ